jgi:hypothetical protein
MRRKVAAQFRYGPINTAVILEVLAIFGEPRRMKAHRRYPAPSFETPRKRAAPQDDG